MARLVLQGNFLGTPAPARAGANPAWVEASMLGLSGLGLSGLGLSGHGGMRIPAALQCSLEQSLGQGLSDVRIHVGRQPQSIGARAFTIGSDIYFAPGQYQPDQVRGQQLLGHEVAHVIQQRQGRVRAPAGPGIAIVVDQALEAEAERLGHRFATTLQRQALRPGPASAARVAQPLKYLRKSIGVGNVEGTTEATEKQIVDWVLTKLSDAEKKNVENCVAYFSAHNGKTTGGGTGFSVGGRTVFHISHGKKDADDGCTLFFTVYPGVDTTVGNVNHRGLIVAIGRHTANTEYKIHWSDTSWTHGNKIKL